MRSSWRWLVLVAVIASACSRGSEESPPAAAPTVAPSPAAAAAPAPQAPAPGTLVVDDDDATVIVDGFQFFVEPADPDTFEIDADASAFMGYTPMLVNFGATALNGTGPFTYTWNFGDGTPTATGDRVSHKFEKTGRIDVTVTGEDAAGDTSNVQLALYVFTPEEWAKTRNLDPATLPTPSPRP